MDVKDSGLAADLMLVSGTLSLPLKVLITFKANFLIRE